MNYSSTDKPTFVYGKELIRTMKFMIPCTLTLILLLSIVNYVIRRINQPGFYCSLALQPPLVKLDILMHPDGWGKSLPVKKACQEKRPNNS